jgi:AraC family transcriptional regulator of adaptative response/methylated-DNA-[protein]-cysteine methyltransferase
MSDLEFNIYKVNSDVGDWLAAFEGKELIFLGSYCAGKKQVEQDLAELFELNYHFKVGKFTPAKWTKGSFFKAKHKIKIQGTEFQMKVWLELLKIPRGKTLTYSEIAKKLRKPSAFRAVASAVAKNPVAFYIPCHRVVGKTQTKASRLQYRWGADLKETLLLLEKAN